MGVDRSAVAGTDAAQGWARAPSGAKSQLFGRHSVDTAERSGMALSAGRVSFTIHVLAAVEAMGGKRSLAQSLAYVVGRLG